MIASDLLPSRQLILDIEQSEIQYMTDRMTAIQNRPGNPEGMKIERFGQATCFYSRTMPWASFNTVKGLTSEDVEHVDPIVDFFRKRGRKAQFEIVPSGADPNLLLCLAERGYYQSGFHTSLVAEPARASGHAAADPIRIEELREDEFELYATIHCRGTGLPDSGIPHVAANNRVLFNRPGWRFYIAYAGESPAAAGVMYMKDGIASFTFAAALPEFRNQGLQQALLGRRMEEAKRHGCRLAVGQCAFLSQSHRNMERVGMKIGYVRTTWTEK